MPALVEKWAKEAKELRPPDGRCNYSFGAFWTWLKNGPHYLYSSLAPCLMLAMFRKRGSKDHEADLAQLDNAQC